MKGKIVLNLAISLDGFISDSDGGYEWIEGHGDESSNSSEVENFLEFLKDYEVVVMGKKCYEQEFYKSAEYRDKIVLIMTHEKREQEGNVKFISGDVVSLVKQETKEGKNVYLFGGGISIDPFVKANVIDEYHIAIIPIILGNGRKLFMDNNPMIPLHLERYTVNDGIVGVTYVKREKTK